MVKVMGEANSHFENKAMDIVKRHCKQVHVDKISKRHSKKGNYVSITFIVHFETKEQMDSLYLELQETPDILMAL